MRFLLTLILLIPFGLNAATQFTEFYCDSGVGTNINSGSTTNAVATYTSVNGNFNGSSTFTPTDGSTPASTVSAGDWAAIYIDGATNLVQSGSGGYIVKITSVAAGVNGAITVSTTALAGTAPSSSATGRSIKVGGAWNGPYGTIGFPFGFLATAATNAPNIFPRCNFKNTAQYNVTAAMTHSLVGPVRFAGMTTTPGDYGRATFDGGAAGTSYVLFTASSVNCDYADLIFANNGNSGSASLVTISADHQTWIRCVVHDAWRAGITCGNTVAFIECEAYACNKANAGQYAGFYITAGRPLFERCISHDNTGNAACGFNLNTSGAVLNDCIVESNGQDGVYMLSSGNRFKGCDFYNNGASGIRFQLATTGSFYAENCNFFNNGAFALTNSAAIRHGEIVNCVLGLGTAANAANFANLGGINEIGTITYTSDSNPWAAPSTGNFSMSNTASTRASGRGLFTQTQAAYTGTISYPDIGAAQSASTNAAAAGGTTAYTFAQ